MSDLRAYAGFSDVSAVTHFDENEGLGAKLLRETCMVASGVRGAVADVLNNPGAKLPEVATAGAFGVGLKSLQKAGARGRILACGVAGGMALKVAYDEMTGDRWSTFGAAAVDTWRSDANYNANVDATKSTIGSFVVDTAAGAAGFKLAGTSVGSRVLYGEMGSKVPLRLARDPFSISATTEGAANPFRGLNTRLSTLEAKAGAPDALISVTSRGSIESIGLQRGLTPGQSARLNATVTFAELASQDAAAADAAAGSTLLGRVGLAGEKTNMTSAFKGAEAYVNGIQGGNQYARFLNERYGSAPDTWLTPSPTAGAATDSLLTRSVEITPPKGATASGPNVSGLSPWNRRGAVGEAARYMDAQAPATDALLSASMEINPRNRAIASNPTVARMSPFDRRAAVDAVGQYMESRAASDIPGAHPLVRDAWIGREAQVLPPHIVDTVTHLTTTFGDDAVRNTTLVNQIADLVGGGRPRAEYEHAYRAMTGMMNDASTWTGPVAPPVTTVPSGG